MIFRNNKNQRDILFFIEFIRSDWFVYPPPFETNITRNDGMKKKKREEKNDNDNDQLDLRQRLQTGLPEGIYYDIISGDHTGNKLITVDQNGWADIYISHDESDVVFATHLKAKLSK